MSVAPVVEELVPLPDPVRCCEQLGDLPYRLFLDSAARSPRLGRYSFLTADPVAIVRSKGARAECEGAPIAGGDALDALRTLLAPFAASPLPELPPFQGGAAGYLAYDWGRVHEHLPSPRYEDLGVPDVVLGVYDWVLAWDHEASRAWLISTGLLEPSPDARARKAAERAGMVLDRLRSTRTPPASQPAAPNTHGTGRPDGPRAPTYRSAAVPDPRLELRSSFTQPATSTPSRVREHPRGRHLQANLSQRFDAPLPNRRGALSPASPRNAARSRRSSTSPRPSC
jgi:anthranilate/para-aminobenzoate synthase component I